jgi:hypothetical protein
MDGMEAATETVESGAETVARDVWTFCASLDRLHGEGGAIDSEAVSGLVGEIVKDRPGLQAEPVGWSVS